MVNTILLGNIISLVGAILMVAIGFIKKRERILIVQCIQMGIMGIGNLVLGGVTGFLVNMLGVVRNLVGIRRPFTRKMQIGFIIVQTIVSAAFNTVGLIGWMPILAAILFTWSLGSDNAVLIKLAIIAAQVMWAAYDLCFHNYTAFAFDVLTICSNLVGIFTLKKQKTE